MRIPYKKTIGQKTKLGRPPVGNRPEKKELIKLYIKEEKSIREIAKHLRCSKDMVYRSLEEHKIERRPGHNRSKLRIYDLAYLKREIKKQGYKEFAFELGVDVSTLRKHIKNRISSQG